MVEAAKRRVEREAAARHARMQESLRLEERLARHAKEWTQSILPDWQNMLVPTTKSILTKHTTGRILIELVKFKTRKILWLEASVTSRTLCSQRCEDNRKLSWLSLFLLPPVGYCQLQIVF